MTPYNSFYSGYGTCLPSLSPSWAGRGQGCCSSSAGDPSKIPLSPSFTDLLRPSPPMSFFPNKTSCGPPTYSSSNGGNCMKLPPISGQICGNHPRDDCCRVPRVPCISEDYCCPKPDNCCQPAANYIELAPRVKKEQIYSPPSVPFDGTTLYRTQFQGCYAPPASSFKPGTTVDVSDGKMDGCSTYRDSFPWKIGETIRIRKEREQYSPPAVPFGGGTTYREDFRGFCITRTPSFKPVATADSSTGRMNGMSSYRTDFIPYCSAECNYARGISMKPATGNGAGMSCSPFQGATTYRMDFIPNIFCLPRVHNPDNSGCA